MTEDDALAVIEASVPRGTLDLLERFVSLLTAAAQSQNLISAATVPLIWQRHILDSTQLVDLDDGVGTWIDIGSGAGLPGMIVAILRDRPVTLVEPRGLRARFLEAAVGELGIASRVDVIAAKAQRVSPRQASVISARAVAGLPDLFDMARHLATPATRWILPRGRTAASEVAAARQLWQARITLVPSKTDSDAAIVVATDVRPRA